MLNFLRKAQDKENLATGLSSMNFLGSPPKAGMQPAAAEASPSELNIVVSPSSTPNYIEDAVQLTPSKQNDATPPQVIQENKPRYDLSVLPRGMEATTPLNMPDRLVFGKNGENLEGVARNWSIAKTPLFTIVQESPIVKRSRITNKINQVANTRGLNISVTRLRLF